jgi:gliding motility-associated-like protein
MATKSLTIPVKRCLYIYVPNAFSPNGDGLNDKMGIEGDFTSLENFTFTIFDRNGMVLFTTHDEYQKWDGTAKGIDVPIGVYVYVIDIKEHMFEPYQLRGSVQVVR